MKITKMLRRARKAIQRLFRLGRTGSGRRGSGRTGSDRTELALCNLAGSQDPAGASHPLVDVGQVASAKNSRDRDREDMDNCWLREEGPVTPKYSGIRGVEIESVVPMLSFTDMDTAEAARRGPYSLEDSCWLR